MRQRRHLLEARDRGLRADGLGEKIARRVVVRRFRSGTRSGNQSWQKESGQDQSQKGSLGLGRLTWGEDHAEPDMTLGVFD